MQSFRLDLVPSKPLLVTPEASETLSMIFQKNEAEILEKRLNESLKLEFRFTQRKESLKQRIREHQERIKETEKSSRRRLDAIESKAFGDIAKALRAEINAISNIFRLEISRDHVIVEGSIKQVSEMSAFYFQIYVDKISSLVCEAFAAMGETVFIARKASR